MINRQKIENCHLLYVDLKKHQELQDSYAAFVQQSPLSSAYKDTLINAYNIVLKDLEDIYSDVQQAFIAGIIADRGI